jgi:chemosensory pili system protein ChpA (sensor histidine kinase/response regulator)
VDSFNLDSIRPVLEADVNRNVGEARAAASKCLLALDGAAEWQAARGRLNSLLTSQGGKPDADWSLLQQTLERASAEEALIRDSLTHVETACAAIDTLLAMELAGRKAEATGHAARQTAATEQLLSGLRAALYATDPKPGKKGKGKQRRAGDPDLQVALAAMQGTRASTLADDDLAALEHCFHSIRGSSSMVALDSLAECASRMETLLRRCRDLVAAHGRTLETLAKVAARLGDNASAEVTASLPGATTPATNDTDLSTFDFEPPSLATADEPHSDEPHSRASALESALSFDQPRPAEPAAPAGNTAGPDFGDDMFDSPSVALPARTTESAASDGNAEFEFTQESTASESGAAAPSVAGADAELVEIFLEEARQCLGDLRRSLGQVATDPANCAAWLDLSRHFHLLKGSAGTVGLGDLAKVASDLEERTESYGERRRVAKPGDVGKLRERAAQMLAAVQLQLDEAPASPDAATVAEDGLAAVFHQEAREILCDTETILAQKRAGKLPNEQQLDQLASLLHRLKGSALLQGSHDIGRRAAALHSLCESHPEGLPAGAFEQLEAGMVELRRLVGMPATSQAPATEATMVAVTIEAEPTIWEAFQTEVHEIVEQLDRIAAHLETAQQPRQQLDEAFRCLHTLKGACNTVGLAPTGGALHALEDYFEHLQAAAVLPPLGSLVRLLQDCLDGVRRNLAQAKGGMVTDLRQTIEQRVRTLREDPRAQTPASTLPVSERHTARATTASDSKEPDSNQPTQKATLRVSAERLDRLMDLVGELVVHRSQLRASVANVNRLQKAMKAGRLRLFGTIDRFREQYEFNGLAARLKQRRDEGAKPATGAGGKRAGSGNEAGFSDIELDHYEDINILARSLEEIDSDMAQIQAQVDAEIETFNASADGFGTLISGLQSEITEARMVAVDQLFLRLRRPIRDAADRLGKHVRVVTTGDDVNLDKTILDQLFGPLLHLVRNAVAHGIEGTADRQAAGKDGGGTIWLAARQESGQIVLEVRDDGRGLDLAALHRLGIERGLLPAGTAVDDPRVKELIFVNGLSTKKQVDAVSGRGVGCDVVRRSIEHLSGVIDVITEAGRGTTFRITMPLTLAIYRALLVRHAGLTFALPISFSERILEAAEADTFESSGVRRLRLDDQFLEVRNLSQMLGMPVAAERGALTVVLRLGPDRLAVDIDEVLGQEEIVVKSLGDVLSGHQMFSGVTIDGEGNLIMILDVAGLFGASSRHTGPRTATIATAAPAATAQQPTPSNRRVRILYADDSLSVRKAAEKFLGDIGADLVLAVDGVDAMEKLRAESFDMVFTDLEMPRMHGFELLREMRYVPSFKNIPVVVVTSRSGDKHRQQAEKLGCNGYLAKPFTPAALQEQICRLTGASRTAGGLVLEMAGSAR